MRGSLYLLIPLLAVGCSNPTPPADSTTSDSAAAATTPSVPTTNTAPESATVDAITIDPLYGAVAIGSESPAAMLNRYMLDLLNQNKARSDAAWAYAPPTHVTLTTPCCACCPTYATCAWTVMWRCRATMASRRACCRCR